MKADEEKYPPAVELGKRGGEKGGPSRARKLGPGARERIARLGAQIRWRNAEEKLKKKS